MHVQDVRESKYIGTGREDIKNSEPTDPAETKTFDDAVVVFVTPVAREPTCVLIVVALLEQASS